MISVKGGHPDFDLFATVDHIGISKRIGSAGERSRLRKVIDAMKPKTGGIEVLNKDTVDPQTVEITLKAKDAFFLFNMGQGDSAIVASESACIDPRCCRCGACTFP